jgi:hypothetical protein
MSMDLRCSLCRVLTDRGTEFCGNPERHECELYPAVENIDHTRTKTKSPYTNGICERPQKTLLNEFYLVTFRKRISRSLVELQQGVDASGSGSAMRTARPRGVGARGRGRWRPFCQAFPWRRKESSMRRPTDTNCLSDIVRSSIGFYTSALLAAYRASFSHK